MTPISETLPPGTAPAAGRKSRLWLWFVAAFVLQLGAWAAWFHIAAKHKVAEVPLVKADTPAATR